VRDAEALLSELQQLKTTEERQAWLHALPPEEQDAAALLVLGETAKAFARMQDALTKWFDVIAESLLPTMERLGEIAEELGLVEEEDDSDQLGLP
jgi:hypothetical protein